MTDATAWPRWRLCASTFLSALVLELFSTLAVALVAVAVGLRLMGGELEFRTALFVLVLAPEAYLPMRALGANFHASAEGVAAAAQVFDVLERPVPARGTRTERPRSQRAPSWRSTESRSCIRDTREPALDGASLCGRAGRDRSR